ncbi:MAG: 5-oxoprolinase subunit PxpB [Verrucomicrobia bacterium]|nr:5-oxoprolinase subunit PxpB [Verrucomicrobiota bacterium]
MGSMETHWLTEDTLLLALGETIDDAVNARVHAVADALRKIGASEVVPAFASLAVRGLSEAAVRAVAEATEVVEAPPAQVVEIPVCYGGEFGPDLDEVVRAIGLSTAEVVARHTAPLYRVHALGFSPGFSYLAGLHPVLALPRRATPRTRVEPGSVGIGGGQTGVYPSATPGGWHLLGRTGRRLFRPECAEAPSLLRPGDGVRFVSVPKSEFVPETAPTLPPSAGAVEVLRAGLLTTVQGAPRVGWADVGVGSGGAMDALSLATANLLLGNAPTMAALEGTLLGPRLQFGRAAVIAVTGAEGSLTVDGQPAPLQRAFPIAAGSILDLGALRRGCRAILAIQGGWQVPEVLGSPSTDLAGGFGGLQGRALQVGDRLEFGAGAGRALAGALSRSLQPTRSTGPLRVLAGPEPAAGLMGAEFVVSPQSDRRGVRLQGPSPLAAGVGTMISGPVRPGTIQLPPDGQPIVLGADAQTLGGYPRIAQVIAADLPRLAQLAPGTTCTFEQVDLAEARAAARRQQRDLALLAAAARLTAR